MFTQDDDMGCNSAVILLVHHSLSTKYKARMFTQEEETVPMRQLLNFSPLQEINNTPFVQASSTDLWSAPFGSNNGVLLVFLVLCDWLVSPPPRKQT
jgi:hypothetical protein